MTSELCSVVERHHRAVIDAILTKIRDSNTPHYRSDGEVLRERITRLVSELAAGACEGPQRFVSYVRRITEERITEGYHLPELQLVFSVAEAEIWSRCVHSMDDRGILLDTLQTLTRMISSAKDELAKVYLEHKEKAEEHAARLQKHLDELFKGTEASEL